VARLSEQGLEERARRLEGHVLRGVTYQGDASVAGDVHTTTHAVHLELGLGRIEVTAADELGIVHGAGISLRDRKVVDRAYGPLHAASVESAWQPLIGTVVKRAIIHWGDIFTSLRGSLSVGISIHADHLRRRDFPMTLELGFAHGVAFVSAARLGRDGRAKPLEPELVVYFSEQAGQALGLRR
jgi:hypothetical protein